MQEVKSFRFVVEDAVAAVRKFVDREAFRSFFGPKDVVLGKRFMKVDEKKFVVPVREAGDGMFTGKKFGFLFVTFGDDCTVVNSVNVCDGSDSQFGKKFGEFGFGEGFFPAAGKFEQVRENFVTV